MSRAAIAIANDLLKITGLRLTGGAGARRSRSEGVRSGVGGQSRSRRDLDWPPTPDLTPSLRERLAPAPPVRRRPVIFRRSFAIAIAALLLLAGGVFAAVPGVRDAVLEFFGLQGATVERRAKLPEAPELRPLRGPAHDARARPQVLGFEPLVPRPPDAGCRLRGQQVPGWRAVARVPPEARPARGTQHESGAAGRRVPRRPGSRVPGQDRGPDDKDRALRVDGQRAIWIEGAPHLFFYRPPDSASRRASCASRQTCCCWSAGT